MVFLRALVLMMLVSPSLAQSKLDEKLAALQTAKPSEISALEREIDRLFNDPKSKTITLLMQRVDQAMQKREQDLAIHLLETVSEIAPNYPQSYVKRAVILIAKNEEGQAIGELEMALKYEPRDFRALAHLGFAFMKIERETEALKAFDLALTLHPTYARVKSHADKLRLKLEGSKL